MTDHDWCAGPALSLTTAVADGAARVVACGELDAGSREELAAAARAARARADRVVLDLSRVDFVDAMGLRTLLDLHADAHVAIVGSPAVDRVLELAGARDRLHRRAGWA